MEWGESSLDFPQFHPNLGLLNRVSQSQEWFDAVRERRGEAAGNGAEERDFRVLHSNFHISEMDLGNRIRAFSHYLFHCFLRCEIPYRCNLLFFFFTFLSSSISPSSVSPSSVLLLPHHLSSPSFFFSFTFCFILFSLIFITPFLLR